ncbi:MAG: ParB/RepB/Spo0J family partition protein [Armatimonadetes bacterium]|nr:ParB/RepB/Spo0J family partition protein [Armatimonadota bacterium]
MKRGLGKGLEALIPTSSFDEEEKGEVREVEIDRIEAGAGQSRKIFDEEKLVELAQSIKEHGLIQPIIVRETGKDRYEIIAGERRWRACRLAGLNKINVLVRDYDDQEAAAASLIENIQRENLNALEEAEAYRELLKRYSLTQEEISRRVGKSRPFITNMLRLLTLPEEIKEMIRNEQITAGHARALLMLDSEEEQKRMAVEIVNKNLSVRATENIIQKIKNRNRRMTERKIINLDLKLIGESEQKLKEIYQADVKIKYLKAGDGKIMIRFKNRENLEQILEMLLR